MARRRVAAKREIIPDLNLTIKLLQNLSTI